MSAKDGGAGEGGGSSIEIDAASAGADSKRRTPSCVATNANTAINKMMQSAVVRVEGVSSAEDWVIGSNSSDVFGLFQFNG